MTQVRGFPRRICEVPSGRGGLRVTRSWGQRVPFLLFLRSWLHWAVQRSFLPYLERLSAIPTNMLRPRKLSRTILNCLVACISLQPQRDSNSKAENHGSTRLIPYFIRVQSQRKLRVVMSASSRPPRCHVTSFSATRQTFLRQRIDACGNGQGVIPRTLSFSPFFPTSNSSSLLLSDTTDAYHNCIWEKKL